MLVVLQVISIFKVKNRIKVEGDLEDPSISLGKKKVRAIPFTWR